MTLPLGYYTESVLKEIAEGIDYFNCAYPKLKAQYPKEVTITYIGVTFTVPFKR